jgi:hypothetical protein
VGVEPFRELLDRDPLADRIVAEVNTAERPA